MDLLNKTILRPKKSLSSKARRKSSRPVAALGFSAGYGGHRPPLQAIIARPSANGAAPSPPGSNVIPCSCRTPSPKASCRKPSVSSKPICPPILPNASPPKPPYLYSRHTHFHKTLNHPGNRGRNTLYVYMRHWTASWLKRERWGLYKQLPRGYSLGHPLPDPQTARPALFLIS